MKNTFSRFGRDRDKHTNEVSNATTILFGQSGAGKSVSVQSAIQVSAEYACVRVIAETIASLPLHVYKSTDEGSAKATEHVLYRILHNEPNREMTSFILRETMLTHLLLWGNSYSQIIRTGRNQIDSLERLPGYARHIADSALIPEQGLPVADGKKVRTRARKTSCQQQEKSQKTADYPLQTPRPLPKNGIFSRQRHPSPAQSKGSSAQSVLRSRPSAGFRGAAARDGVRQSVGDIAEGCQTET